MPSINFTQEAPISVSFDYAVTDRQDKLIMLRHSQEVKEFILNINFKGLFMLAVYLHSNGNKVYIQDKATKYNDFISSSGQIHDKTKSGTGSLSVKNHRYYEVPFKKYIQTLLVNVVQ